MRRLSTACALGCFLFAAVVLPCRADDPANTSSNIRASLKLAPDFHEITLEVANHGGDLVCIEYRLGCIDTYIHRDAKVPDDAPAATSSITDLRVVEVFIANPAYHPPGWELMGEAYSGAEFIPMRVDPGTNKKMSYSLTPFPTDQKYSEIRFLVLSGDKVLAKLILKNDGKTWKQPAENPSAQ